MGRPGRGSNNLAAAHMQDKPAWSRHAAQCSRGVTAAQPGVKAFSTGSKSVRNSW
ncbi:MAG TPA: hypothetical protein VFS25_16010 [Chitinophaga sp.]|uniref:hypothetical protein n=1 Tax=Chitinophaga sp. TaxID=1869181 RepID=UPI002DBA96AB|nr:hypothetical protein [Chitinophaga sp.]HEU4554352.1 hypothetical protein [Chitinophaga sp.]